MRQSIGIPMGIDPAPFWANLYLYSYEEEFISNLVDSGEKVRARHFHACRRFIDDLCAMNDGGEFGRSFSEIYPEELELKETVFPCKCKQSGILIFLVKYLISETCMVK